MAEVDPIASETTPETSIADAKREAERDENFARVARENRERCSGWRGKTYKGAKKFERKLERGG
jgi:hypothetical protein